jgi:superfamily II DNA/RNA helicase
MPRRTKVVDGVALRDIGMHTHVAKVFESQNLGIANALQSTILSAVIEGSDVFAEAMPHSGRKVAALMCVHQVLLTVAEYRGPSAIILVPSITRMNGYAHLFDICKPAGIRVTFYNEEQHGLPGDIVLVTARRLNELILSEVVTPSKLVILVIDDVSSFEVNALERVVSAIRSRSQSCMIAAFSQSYSTRADSVARQYMRRERRYFFQSLGEGTQTSYKFFLCKEKEKVPHVAGIMHSVWTPGKKTLILTSRRECRHYFEYLNSDGAECYYLVSTTSPQDYQRILHEFLLEDVSWSILIVGGKLQEVDLVDVDIVILTSPPSHILNDEAECKMFCRHFTDTIAPQKPLDIFVLSTVDELPDVARMQEELGIHGDVVDISPTYPRFEMVLRSDNPRAIAGSRCFEM